MAHFGILRSIPAHSQYLSSLFSWVYIDWRLLVIDARSSAYAAKLIVNLDVPNVYPFFPICSHLSSGSKNIRKRYGLSVALYCASLYRYEFCFTKVLAGEYGVKVGLNISY